MLGDLHVQFGNRHMLVMVDVEFHCLGGITFTLFLLQVASGFAMTFYYRPTVAEAFASVQYIMTDVSFGWVIRSIHRWSASMMVLAMILPRISCIFNRWALKNLEN